MSRGQMFCEGRLNIWVHLGLKTVEGGLKEKEGGNIISNAQTLKKLFWEKKTHLLLEKPACFFWTFRQKRCWCPLLDHNFQGFYTSGTAWGSLTECFSSPAAHIFDPTGFKELTCQIQTTQRSERCCTRSLCRDAAPRSAASTAPFCF